MNNVFMVTDTELPEYVYKKWNNINNNLNLQIYYKDSLDSYANKHFEEYFIKVLKNIKPKNRIFLFALLCLYYNGGIYINPEYNPDISPNIIFEKSKSSAFFVLKNFNMEIEENFFGVKEKFNPFILAIITNICNKHYNPKKSYVNYLELFKSLMPRSAALRNNKEYNIFNHKCLFLHQKPSKKNTQINSFPIYFDNFKNNSINILKNSFNSKFKAKIKGKKLYIQRLDKTSGWDFDLNISILIKEKRRICFLNSSKDEFTKKYSIFYKDEKILGEKYSTTDIYDILNDNNDEEDIDDEEDNDDNNNDNDNDNDDNNNDISVIKFVLDNIINNIILDSSENTILDNICLTSNSIKPEKKKENIYQIFSGDQILYNSNEKTNNNISFVISEKRKETKLQQQTSIIMITGNFYKCYSNNMFKNFIKNIIKNNKKVTIIIHTWLTSGRNIINVKLIENYFGKEISKYIEHIEIDNYKNISEKQKLIPEQRGLLFLKNEWYTKNKITKLLSIIEKQILLVMSINFDIFNKLENWKLGLNQKTITSYFNKKIYDDKIILFNNTIQEGISNCYIGSSKAINKLHNTLDTQFHIIYNIFRNTKFPDEVFFHVVKKINEDLVKEQINSFIK